MSERKTCDKGECCRQELQGQLRASLSREAALREALQELLDAGWEQDTLAGGQRRMAAEANARHALAN